MKGTLCFTHIYLANRIFWVVEIKCPLVVGVHIFSSVIDAYMFFANEWNDLSRRGLTLYIKKGVSFEVANIISYYLEAAFCQQGYLASKIENHQVYITNGRY